MPVRRRNEGKRCASTTRCAPVSRRRWLKIWLRLFEATVEGKSRRSKAQSSGGCRGLPVRKRRDRFRELKIHDAAYKVMRCIGVAGGGRRKQGAKVL